MRDSTAKGQRRANYTRSEGKNRGWQVKPEADWILVPCEPIVSEELWNDCNRLLDEQETSRTPIGPKAVYLLSGFVTCGCGKKMYVYQHSKNYACKACKTRIAVDDLDEIYQIYLKEYLGSINPAEYLTRGDEQLQEKKTLLASTQAERNKLAKRINTMLILRLDGDMSKEQFNEHYKPLEERVAQLDKQLPELEAEVDIRTIQLQSTDIVMSEAKALYDQWADMPFEQKRSIVEMITNTIEIGKEEITINLAYAPAIPSNAENSSHHLMVALPFYRHRKTIARPLKRSYPSCPQTLGEHIKKARIDKGLSQKQLASMLGVSEDSVTYWENERSKPQIRYYPAIINLVGYYPFTHETETLAGKLKQIRYMNGHDFNHFASVLNVSVDAAKRWERGKPIMNPRLRALVQTLWQQLPLSPDYPILQLSS